MSKHYVFKLGLLFSKYLETSICLSKEVYFFWGGGFDHETHTPVLIGFPS